VVLGMVEVRAERVKVYATDDQTGSTNAKAVMWRTCAGKKRGKKTQPPVGAGLTIRRKERWKKLERDGVKRRRRGSETKRGTKGLPWKDQGGAADV